MGKNRKGAGRPYQYQYLRRVGLHLTESIDDALEEEAQNQGITKSELVRRVLAKRFKVDEDWRL